MTIPQLTQAQRELILFEETEREFGYKVVDLTFGSPRKIIHKCVVCGKPKRSLFREFLRNEKQSHYECKSIKAKQTNLKRYGVVSTALVPEIKAKQKQTLQERYGVEHPIQALEVQVKMKQTMRDRYGVDYYTQAPEMQEKSKETCLEKYGVEHSAQSAIKREKSKQTCLNKYGVDCTAKVPEIRERQKQTLLDRYGVLNPRQLEGVVEKARPKRMQTWLKTKGVDCLPENAELVALQYIQQELQKEGYKLVSNQYVNTTTKIEVQCPKEHIYPVRWIDFQLGYRCAICSEGKSERELGKILEQLYPGLVKPQDNLDFLGQLRADYSVRINNLAFEYDGKQHFEPMVGMFGCHTEEEAFARLRTQQKRDKRKNRLCKKNGYRLIRIAYTEKLCLETIQQKLFD